MSLAKVIPLLLLLLTACRQAPAGELGSVVPPTAMPTALPTLTPTTPANQIYRDVDAGFSLNVPDDWVIGPPRLTALGRQVMLGPAPLGPGPASSTLLVADAANLDIETAALQLECGGDCPDELVWHETTIDDRPARRTLIGAGGPAPLEWHFLEHNGRLIFFTLHDPATLVSRDDLVATLRLDETIAAVTLTPATPTPTSTRRPTATRRGTATPEATAESQSAATPEATETAASPATASSTTTPTTVPTATPAGDTTATQPPTPLTVAIDFYQAVYEDPEGATSWQYLSRRLRDQLGPGETVLSLLGIQHRFAYFRVAWDDPISDGRIRIAATLIYIDGTELERITELIFEDDGWRIDAILSR